MKLKPSSTFKRLVNAVGKVDHLKPFDQRNPVDALRLPKYYKYENISLYSGDWRNIKCNCVHLHDEASLRRELVLARVAKYNPVLENESNYTKGTENNTPSAFSVVEVTGYLPHIRYFSYGKLSEVENELMRRQQKSLLIPLDSVDDRDYIFIEQLAEDVKTLLRLEKVVICVSDDNTWSVFNRLLKS